MRVSSQIKFQLSAFGFLAVTVRAGRLSVAFWPAPEVDVDLRTRTVV